MYEEKTMVIGIGDETLSLPHLCCRDPSFGDSQGNSDDRGQSFDWRDEKGDTFDKTKEINNINNDDDDDDDDVAIMLFMAIIKR